jgi:hypothetical protein
MLPQQINGYLLLGGSLIHVCYKIFLGAGLVNRRSKRRMEDKQKMAYRIGWTVLLLLSILTIGEFFIGSIASAWWAVLLGVALLKAFFIVRDYMHIGRLFSEEEVQE